MWQWWIILLNLRIHLPHLVTHNGLSNLLSLAALSVSLSAPNGSVISAVSVPLWILLTVLSARRRKCIYLYTGTEAHMLLGLRLNRFPLFWHDFGAVCQLYLQIRWNGFTSDTVRPSLVGCLSKTSFESCSEALDLLLISLLKSSWAMRGICGSRGRDTLKKDF